MGRPTYEAPTREYTHKIRDQSYLILHTQTHTNTSKHTTWFVSIYPHSRALRAYRSCLPGIERRHRDPARTTPGWPPTSYIAHGDIAIAPTGPLRRHHTRW